MKIWFVGSALFGLLSNVIVLFLIRGHVKVSPLIAVTLWPTMLVMANGIFGITGRLLFGFSVLLNAAVYGAMGWVTGSSSRDAEGKKEVRRSAATDLRDGASGTS